MHCIVFHFTALHCTGLHCSAVQFTALNCNIYHYNIFQYTAHTAMQWLHSQISLFRFKSPNNVIAHGRRRTFSLNQQYNNPRRSGWPYIVNSTIWTVRCIKGFLFVISFLCVFLSPQEHYAAIKIQAKDDYWMARKLYWVASFVAN